MISDAAGRATAYAIVGLLVASGIAAAPTASGLLQTALEPFIGPFLILAGLLLRWIPLNLNLGPAKPGVTEGLADRGLPGAFLLGVRFAVTFSATSAILFIGSLLPQTSNAWLIVGIGTYLTRSG